jgi:hypothetical protein
MNRDKLIASGVAAWTALPTYLTPARVVMCRSTGFGGNRCALWNYHPQRICRLPGLSAIDLKSIPTPIHTQCHDGLARPRSFSRTDAPESFR